MTFLEALEINLAAATEMESQRVYTTIEEYKERPLLAPGMSVAAHMYREHFRLDGEIPMSNCPKCER